MGDVTKLIDAMQEAVGFIVALKEQKARFVLEKAIAEYADTRRVASADDTDREFFRRVAEAAAEWASSPRAKNERPEALAMYDAIAPHVGWRHFPPTRAQAASAGEPVALTFDEYWERTWEDTHEQHSLTPRMIAMAAWLAARLSVPKVKASGWVEPMSLDHLEKLNGVGHVPLWNTPSGNERIPLYAAPTPDSRDSDRSAAYREVTLEEWLRGVQANPNVTLTTDQEYWARRAWHDASQTQTRQPREEDASELVNRYYAELGNQQNIVPGAMLAALRSIHAVIRIPAGAGEK